MVDGGQQMAGGVGECHSIEEGLNTTKMWRKVELNACLLADLGHTLRNPRGELSVNEEALATKVFKSRLGHGALTPA